MKQNDQLLELTVERVLTDWPDSISLFRKFQMLDCIGCQIGPFCTLAEALKTHNVVVSEFLRELKEVIAASNL